MARKLEYNCPVAKRAGKSVKLDMTEEKKKLFRSRTDYIISGLAGGLAGYFGVEPTLIRLVFILLCFGGGGGLLLYIVLTIVIPREPGEISKVSREKKVLTMANKIGEKTKGLVDEIDWKPQKKGRMIGMILIIIGGVALWNQIMPFYIRLEIWFPLMMIGAGLWVIFKK